MKVLDREGSWFAFLRERFPRISIEKLKVGIFEGPQIRELIKYPMFGKALRDAVLSTEQSLKSPVTNFLRTSGVRNTRGKLKCY